MSQPPRSTCLHAGRAQSLTASEFPQTDWVFLAHPSTVF